MAVVKVRAHDAECQILLDALIKVGATKPPAQRLLRGDEQRAAKKCAYGCA
jgi:hypothetical protein